MLRRAEGQARRRLFGSLDVGLAESKVTTKEVPLDTGGVHEIVIVVCHTAAFAGEDAKGVFHVSGCALEEMTTDADAHLAIDRKDAVHDRALHELLAARGVDALTVVVDFPLPHANPKLLVLSDIDTPINHTCTRVRAAVVRVSGRL